jgi:hypothetical protein
MGRRRCSQEDDPDGEVERNTSKKAGSGAWMRQWIACEKVANGERNVLAMPDERELQDSQYAILSREVTRLLGRCFREQ